MAWFTYECPTHGQFRQDLEERLPQHKCQSCDQMCDTVLKSGGTISVVERLDNGVMGRAVERLHNIEEIMNERADKHSAENEE